MFAVKRRLMLPLLCPAADMNAGQRELEGRLDDLLLRIAMETQEIKELEQQLTDGQILANEALQRELQGVICGLQEYLKRLRQQCCRSQQQVDSLQAENQRLQLHLEDAQRHCKQLEDRAHLQTKSMEVQQGELLVLQKEAQALREQQMESDRRQAELEAELLQLKEELTWQEENLSLQIEVQTLQSYLYQTRTQMEQFTAVPSEPEEKQTPEELDGGKTRPTRTQETLSRSVKQLYGIKQTRTSTQQLQQDYTHTIQAQLTQDHMDELEAQLEDLMTQDRTAHVVDQDLDWRLREELQRLRDQLEKCQKRSWLIQQNLELEVEQSRFQLQVVQQERDTLLQQLRSLTDGHQRSLGRLNKKLRQLNRFICDADHLTAEQLRSTAEQLRALNHTVDLLHAQKNVEEPDGNLLHDGHTVDQLQAEPACTWKHTHRLKTGGIKTRTKTRTRGESIAGEGRWWFVPAELNAPSLASQGTQDSGLGLQYLSSPERRRQWTRPPTRGGYWVHFPLKHTDWRDSSSNEGTPPPPPPPETAVGGSDGSSPLGPSGPVSGSPSGGTALHCNIPKHGDLQGGSCDCLHKEAERIQEERKKLRLNTKKLRYMLRQHSSVMQVCDQVECVEKTLLKRQAELRQTDKLLLEAQSCLHKTRDQAARLQHRAEDCATCLLEALLHLRKHREEAEQVRMKRGQEQALREIKQALKSTDEEYQQLCRKRHTAMYRLAEVLSDCQEAQRHLESLTCQEQKLVQRREEELRKEEQRLRAAFSSHRAGGEEEPRRGREERRSLQEQCRHLET